MHVEVPARQRVGDPHRLRGQEVVVRQHGRDPHADGVRRVAPLFRGDRQADVGVAVPDLGIADDVLALDRELEAGLELLAREDRLVGDRLEGRRTAADSLEQADVIFRRRGGDVDATRGVARHRRWLRLEARQIACVVLAVDDLVPCVIAERDRPIARGRLAALHIVVDVGEEDRADLGVPPRLVRVRVVVDADLAVAVRVGAQIGEMGVLGAALVGAARDHAGK